jgi:hypothetical protein
MKLGIVGSGCDSFLTEKVRHARVVNFQQTSGELVIQSVE